MMSFYTIFKSVALGKMLCLQGRGFDQFTVAQISKCLSVVLGIATQLWVEAQEKLKKEETLDL